jgi:phage/plasmid-like protein (TIGR03299 family)
MAHNIDMTGNRANMAFLGSRNDIWHRLGQEMQPGQSMQEWSKSAGLDWQAVMVRAYADVSELPVLKGGDTWREVEGRRFVCRSDNGQPLGYVSDGYQPVQPLDVLEWFERYIAVDPRFQLDVAGSLKKGEIIWATATYRDRLDVAGDEHRARLLMTTTFDGSGATVNKGTMVRVVCNNTLDAALADGGKCVVKTRHNTKFDAARVGKELARIAEGFTAYKAMGEALYANEMSAEQVSLFFKSMLDIPFDAKWSELSGKKQNQFDALRDAHKTTARETKGNTAWAALNAITRYVDHDKATRGGDSEDEARVLSSQFGSGAALKAKAVAFLMPDRKLQLVA